MENIEAIITEVKNGDKKQFELIVETYQQRLFTYCLHMLGSVQEAEDTTQEAFIKIYKKLGTYRENTQFQAWIYKIAYNECIDVLRKKKKAGLMHCMDDLLYLRKAKESSNNDYQEPLHSALSRLSAEDRTVLILRIVEDKPYEEISVIMDKNPAALRKQFERAKLKLKNNFKEVIPNEKVSTF